MKCQIEQHINRLKRHRRMPLCCPGACRYAGNLQTTGSRTARFEVPGPQPLAGDISESPRGSGQPSRLAFHLEQRAERGAVTTLDGELALGNAGTPGVEAVGTALGGGPANVGACPEKAFGRVLPVAADAPQDVVADGVAAVDVTGSSGV